MGKYSVFNRHKNPLFGVLAKQQQLKIIAVDVLYTRRCACIGIGR